MTHDVVIIGGGLSGLRLAARLAAQGVDFQLLEGRDRLGGRIESATAGNSHYDLGPTWFWPGQPRIAALIDQLGLTFFEQFADGILTYEDEHGQVQRGRGFASMAGSLRVQGGMGALVDALALTLPQDRIALSQRVTHLTRGADMIDVKCQSGASLSARKVVLALPPRLASTFTYAPALSPDAVRAMQDVPSWMAGQAKAVAVYNKPFWRDAGLSGDGMSRRGPLVEIHDASPAAGGPYAMFGFIGTPPNAREDVARLQEAIRAQLGRLFGPEAAAPTQLFLKDWAFDALTSMPLDLQPLYTHPRYGRPAVLQGLWDGRLLFAGTEVAPEFGGYLEGALEAADDVFAMLVPERV